MHSLWIDGKNLKEFGIYVSGEHTYNAPAWDVHTEAIPGRHGELLYPYDRLKPMEVRYPAFIRQKFPEFSAQARLHLMGKHGWRRIEDEYHLGFYRMGYFAGPLDFDTRFLNLSAEMELVFSCQPQRWLKSGELPMAVTTGESIYNAWMPAKPIIQVMGSGNGVLWIGGRAVTISSMDEGEWLSIDCDTQNAYSGTVNQNKNIQVSGGFPILNHGDTTVTYSGGIQTVKIIPRWWSV